MQLQTISQKSIPILRSYDVSFAAIFGSTARGEDKKKSDIDILVRFSKPKSLFDLVGLEQDLEKKFKKDVDVVTENALHPILKKHIIKDLKVIYGKR